MFHCIVRQLSYLLVFCICHPDSIVFPFVSAPCSKFWAQMCAKHLLEMSLPSKPVTYLGFIPTVSKNGHRSFNNKKKLKNRGFRGWKASYIFIHTHLYWWTSFNFYLPLAELKSFLWCISSTSCPRAVLLHLLLLWSAAENLNWCLTSHTAFLPEIQIVLLQL